MMMLAAQLFLDTNVSSACKLMNFTICSFMDVIKSPFMEFMEVKSTTSHTVMLRTDNCVQTTAEKLACFLKNNSSQSNV